MPPKQSMKSATIEKPAENIKPKKPSKALTKENLILLGAEQLADLLLEISKGNAVSQRILRTALAGAVGFGEAAKEIRKRLISLARTKTALDAPKKKTLLKDLEGLKNQILKQVLPSNASEANDLMWSLLRLSTGIIERSYDNCVALSDFFDGVMQEISNCSIAAKEKPYILAERMYNDILDNDYGQYHKFVSIMTEALGTEGLKLLRTKLKDKNSDHRKVYFLNRVLGQVELALNNIDGYIGLQSEYALKIPKEAAFIAHRLLQLNRYKDAQKILDNADIERYEDESDEWAEAKVALLEALNQPNEAQDFRYAFFKRVLSIDMLKSYLKQLPEFKDFTAEQQALDYVKTFDDVHHALYFFTQWHAPKHLNDMVLQRVQEIDGNLYELLPMGAKVLASEHPLTAVLVLRKLIDDTLNHAKSSRYKHTARHLSECISLSHYISDYQGHISHKDYMTNLKKLHGKKYSFWELMADKVEAK